MFSLEISFRKVRCISLVDIEEHSLQTLLLMRGCAFSVMLLTLAVVLSTGHDYSGTYYLREAQCQVYSLKEGSVPFQNSLGRTLAEQWSVLAVLLSSATSLWPLSDYSAATAQNASAVSCFSSLWCLLCGGLSKCGVTLHNLHLPPSAADRSTWSRS